MSDDELMMLELFRSELDTHMPVLTSGLLSLEKIDGPSTDVNGMMRAAHSIKGAARIAGLPRVVEVAHELEDCLTAAFERKITLTPESVDHLLRAVDLLKILTDFLGEHVRDVGPDTAQYAADILDRVKAIRAGNPTFKVVATRKPSGTFSMPAVLDHAACEVLRQQVQQRHAIGGEIIFDASAVRDVRHSLVAFISTLLHNQISFSVVSPAPEFASLMRLLGVRVS